MDTNASIELIMEVQELNEAEAILRSVEVRLKRAGAGGLAARAGSLAQAVAMRCEERASR